MKTNTGQKTLPPNLRPADLVAKLAGVSLKDTVKVIVAIDLLREDLGFENDGLVQMLIDQLQTDRPDTDNVAECERIYAEVLERCRTPAWRQRVGLLVALSNGRLSSRFV